MALRERFTLLLDPRLGAAPWPSHGPQTVRLGVGVGPQRARSGWIGDRLEATGVRLARGPSGIEGACAPDRQTLNRAVRFAFQPALLREGWLMLHASCALGRRGAHLFVGPSGVGKTTLLRRLVALGARPFGDEVVLARAGEAEAFPFQPWPAEGTASIASVHLLVRGNEGSEVLGTREAVAGLLRQVLVYESGEAAALALEAATQLVMTVGEARRTAVGDDDESARRLWDLLGERP